MKFLLIIALLLAAVSAQSSIYDQYYQEALKIAQSMTIDQKIGQTIQADFQAITKDDK
jgi:cytochrome c oxidase assembly factor CtaG